MKEHKYRVVVRGVVHIGVIEGYEKRINEVLVYLDLADDRRTGHGGGEEERIGVEEACLFVPAAECARDRAELLGDVRRLVRLCLHKHSKSALK